MSHVGVIDWTPPGVRVTRRCPVCGTRQAHPQVLAVTDGLLQRQRLLLCRGCSSRFYASLAALDYHDEAGTEFQRRFYLEQGAGIDHMIRPLFELDRPTAHSLLDVGCGFGFAVIAARHVLGWRAVGLDPGHYADDGRKLGEADIRRTMLTDDLELGAPFDLVLASEVIEHVPDPSAFLALLRRRMAPGGALALTTPNGACIDPALPAGEILQLLSPGGHLVLFTPESLEACLRTAGFAHVRVEPRGTGIAAYASDRPLSLRPGTDPARHDGYRALLRHLLDRAAPASALWNGAAHRLLVSAGDDIEAWGVFHRIADVWRAAFGFDIAAPDGLPAPLPHTPDPAPGWPFCVSGVLLARARLERRSSARCPLRAIAYLRRTLALATHARAKVLGAHLEDLALRQTARQARVELARTLGELAPELEGDLVAALAHPSLMPDRALFDLDPAEVLRIAAPRFTALVHAGDYRTAQRFGPLFADTAQVRDAVAYDTPLLLHVLFCRAVLLLNGDRNHAAAQSAFGDLHEAALAIDAASAHSQVAHHFARLAQAHLSPPDATCPEAERGDHDARSVV